MSPCLISFGSKVLHCLVYKRWVGISSDYDTVMSYKLSWCPFGGEPSCSTYFWLLSEFFGPVIQNATRFKPGGVYRLIQQSATGTNSGLVFNQDKPAWCRKNTTGHTWCIYIYTHIYIYICNIYKGGCKEPVLLTGNKERWCILPRSCCGKNPSTSAGRYDSMW